MEYNPEKIMPLMEHLRELRICLVKVIVCIAFGAICGCFISEEIFKLVTFPMRHLSLPFEFIGTKPTEAFVVKLKLSVYFGVVLSLPYVLYQIWNFIAPGLKEREKSGAIPFVSICTGLFICGVVFCFFVVLPCAMSFFLREYASIGVKANIGITEYVSFATDIMMIFGFVFELPVITFYLAKCGLVSHSFMLKNVKLSIVFIFIISAILTPPDVISQILLAVPLLVLYAICILIAYRFGADNSACRNSLK